MPNGYVTLSQEKMMSAFLQINPNNHDVIYLNPSLIVGVSKYVVKKDSNETWDVVVYAGGMSIKIAQEETSESADQYVQDIMELLDTPESSAKKSARPGRANKTLSRRNVPLRHELQQELDGEFLRELRALEADEVHCDVEEDDSPAANHSGYLSGQRQNSVSIPTIPAPSHDPNSSRGDGLPPALSVSRQLHRNNRPTSVRGTSYMSGGAVISGEQPAAETGSPHYSLPMDVLLGRREGVPLSTRLGTTRVSQIPNDL
jgi:hypothetical protein